VDVFNIYGLIGVVIANTSAIMIVYLKNKRANSENYGIKNGRGNLFQQVGKLQDDMVEIREDVAEVKGAMRVLLSDKEAK
tara:strand:+ start:3378 stop:3617 length:240 start_codon:yes stop_codon:yes gene_type:complete